ncbi:mgpp2cl-1, protein phosphatase 2C-like protein 1 [Yamadazyma tenuis]|uniref:mgpp2cl-1, protein phosphatase 2C-like protein 1 n=1 Tax=Candida tenuis TaxID=2315449 RepID=UPI0027A94CEC|nr:mgpp2cl-1, protein phosphatase 2C-like protein 1 [Yamadazyma tenuis]
MSSLGTHTGSNISLNSFTSQARNSSTSNLSQVSNVDPFYGLSFKVGVAENKNITYQSKMEDVHTYVANFAERLDWGYFAVFDGHAGKQTARWCGNNLHTLLEQEIISNEESVISTEVDMKDNLYKSFMKADELISKENAGNSGSTAAVVVLLWENRGDAIPADTTDTNNTKGSYSVDFSNQHRMLYTANVGDSRIVLYRNGEAYRLSYDHKASDINEINRVRDSGGLIMKNRVNGILAVTRSLGDLYMKDLVVGKPFTTSTVLGEYDEFMILACDGLWDVVSDGKACEAVKQSFRTSDDPEVAAKRLCQLALDNSTTDNITVMVVKFDNSIFKSND